MTVVVNIRNIEPAWIKYGLQVTLSDEEAADLDDAELHDLVMERVHAARCDITYGPDVIGQIDGMDQEFEIEEIDR